MFLFLFCLVVLYFIGTHYLEKLEIDNLKRRAVFITGCDSGFGYALALKCLAQGMPVFAGCLTESGGENLRKRARNLSGKLEIVLVDVSSDESVANAKKLLEEKTKEYGGLHGVVNNAGIVGTAFVDDLLNVDDYKKTAEVNVWGIIRVTHAVKELIKRARGRVVVVTSVCARLAIPANGPYTVSKHAASGYCETIRKELAPWGVKVSVLEPGFFKTAITDPKVVSRIIDSVWKRASPDLREAYGVDFLKESQDMVHKFLASIGSDRIDLVVEAYFHALTAVFPRPRYQVGNDSKFLWGPLSLLPTRLQDLVFNLQGVLAGHPLPAALRRAKSQ